MLIPKRVKFRRQHRPTRSGMSKGGNKVTFGEYGLQALEPAYITNRQIEAARIAINRHVKRGGKVWIQIFPDRPLTQKPLGVRMGSGKGPVEKWVANVKPGRIMFEMSYPDEAVAIEALKRAGAKLPIKTRIVRKEDQY
ncbi:MULTISPECIES: 50S ribosomal protein L16 [Corynebacterium]|uniref:Large ribosomal subunit protein uL16 n=1 Tax=Corynebacterium amycolatum TaxID=43765 RepID=A0AB38XWJ6_CORAY|nr:MULTISPECIES: 50S ribosomal protein L16 [Corynebacterium]AIN81966.1 ribosomal protein L16 [Corynebacterium sp. ATCC 6931]EEB63745.1 ribosomal protein L16 [Corynebacterium amycolatum SK46]KAA9269547.1 50S ribosomal protein L16 [Corynebacterium amycolatum]KAA9289318.1 50S ribosomal protein L16 [Corynebacterium amycolatum]MBC6726238.1 50S ribosomal protein L16 [Corynebacterium amycolatum]